jgi:two-component system alkaline phosphatase synthesis response regulator PhoP
MNILLVDDEPHYLMLLGDFLRNQGWSVLTAENGEDALGVLKEHKIDIVISDIYMPILNGVDLQKNMRRIPGCESTPFIFVSAYADSSTLATLDLSDSVKYLSKSVSPAKLKEWIQYLTTPAGHRMKHPGEETISHTEGRTINRDPRIPPRRR